MAVWGPAAAPIMNFLMESYTFCVPLSELSQGRGQPDSVANTIFASEAASILALNFYLIPAHLARKFVVHFKCQVEIGSKQIPLLSQPRSLVFHFGPSLVGRQWK